MFLQMQVWALLLLQEGGAVSFDLRSMWNQMGPLAKFVVIILFFMSAWFETATASPISMVSLLPYWTRHPTPRPPPGP